MKILAIIYTKGIALYKTPRENIGVHSVFLGEVYGQVFVDSLGSEWALRIVNHSCAHHLYVDLIQKGD